MAANLPAKDSALPYPVLITVKSDEEEEDSPSDKKSANEAASGQHGVHIHVVRGENNSASAPLNGTEKRDTSSSVDLLASQTAAGGGISVLMNSSSSMPPPLFTTPGKMDSSLFPVNDRFTQGQAQTMGKQVLAVMESTRKDSSLKLPTELQSSFDIVHRCLGVIYGTFFLNMYFKANAPCILCHACHGVYPPSQFIHHPCSGMQRLDIVPCKSRMWRRCLIPLVSQNMDKLQQKQRWKYVVEKFSHAQTGVNRRSVSVMGPVLEMPELKRGRFVASPGREEEETQTNATPTHLSPGSDGQTTVDRVVHLLDTDDMLDAADSDDNLEESSPSPLDLAAPHSQVGSNGWVGGVIQPSSNLAYSTHTLVPSSAVAHTHTMVSSGPHHLSVLPMATAVPLDVRLASDPLSPTSSAIGLAENLLYAVKRLQGELASAQAKLMVAEQQLKELPSESAMRVQLSEALAAQQKLRIDRDVALQRCKMADERSGRLESQLRDLKILHSQFGAKLSNI